MTVDPWSPSAWRAPCFESAGVLLEAFAELERWPTLAELERAWFGDVRSAAGGLLRLVPQPPTRRRGTRLRDDLYDARVARGELPTREGSWHDLFNVAMFRAFARTKAALHQRQHAIILERVPARFERLPGARTREQDALALLDEGGVIVAVPPAELEATERCLQGAGTTDSLPPTSAHVWVLGHALLEHVALAALGAATGPEPHALAIAVATPAPRDRTEVDRALAARLTQRAYLSEPPAHLALPLSYWYPPHER